MNSALLDDSIWMCRKEGIWSCPSQSLLGCWSGIWLAPWPGFWDTSPHTLSIEALHELRVAEPAVINAFRIIIQSKLRHYAEILLNQNSPAGITEADKIDGHCCQLRLFCSPQASGASLPKVLFKLPQTSKQSATTDAVAYAADAAGFELHVNSLYDHLSITAFFWQTYPSPQIGIRLIKEEAQEFVNMQQIDFHFMREPKT